jgi:sarcosine reductase
MEAKKMKLAMATFQVDRIEAAQHTTWENGILYVNMKELRQLVLEDETFTDVSIEWVNPGEKTRIVHVLDAVEPRVKVEGPSCCFPGFLGPAHTAGSGMTHRMSGIAVLGIGLGIEVPTSETGVLGFNEGFIDMTGPAQKYCACSDTINICLCFTERKGCTHAEFDSSTRLATLKAADYLAKCTIGGKPSDQVVYDLRPVVNDLPRIAYINQIQSQGFLCRTFLYGAPIDDCFTPTLLHPNEVLDGALVSGNYRSHLKACTFLQQNNFVILELLKRHGKDLDFVGQIIGRGHFEDYFMKERQGQYAAKLASFLNAQASLLTMEGSGNAFVDYMATVSALELSGICAVPILHEYGGTKGDDQPLVHFVPEAVSIVSGGGIDRLVDVPSMDRVVGGSKLRFKGGDLAFKDIDASSSFAASPLHFYCGLWQMGVSGLSAVDY